MRAKIVSDEILYPDEPVVLVNRADVDALKCAAARATRQRVRLCAHRDVGAAVHEMLIVHAQGTYVPPHKHPGKSESFHLVQGVVDVVIFDDDGQIAAVIAMGDFASGRPFYYRMADPLYHTLLIRSPVVVFHETTGGPFRREDTRFAAWAPAETDAAAVQQFLDALEERVAQRKVASGGSGA